MNDAQRPYHDRDIIARTLSQTIMDKSSDWDIYPGYSAISVVSPDPRTFRYWSSWLAFRFNRLPGFRVSALADDTCNKVFWHHYIPLQLTTFRKHYEVLAEFVYLAIFGPDVGSMEDIARTVGDAFAGKIFGGVEPDGHSRDSTGGPAVPVYIDRFGLMEGDCICCKGVDVSPFSRSEIFDLMDVINMPPELGCTDEDEQGQ